MTRVVGKKSGALYALEPRALIGQGVEGRVYRARGQCVKVFAAAMPDEKIELIEALVGLGKKIPGFAWPTEVATDPDSGRAVGYAMAWVEGANLDSLILDRDTTRIPVVAKVKLALDAANAVAAAHAGRAPKIVLGDLIKAANLVVSDAEAVFVDTVTVSLFGFRVASGDVRDAISTVSTPGYVPKEVLENPRAVPSQADDLFRLAVVLFELLFGRPPHEPKPCPAAVGLEPDDAVRLGIYPRYIRHPDFEVPTYDPIDPPDEIEDLFRAALLSPIRPPADLWRRALEDWLVKITPKAADDPVAPPRPTSLQRVWATAERLIGVAVVLWLSARGVAWIQPGSVEPPVREAPHPVEFPSPPLTPVGPPLFKVLFR